MDTFNRNFYQSDVGKFRFRQIDNFNDWRNQNEKFISKRRPKSKSKKSKKETLKFFFYFWLLKWPTKTRKKSFLVFCTWIEKQKKNVWQRSPMDAATATKWTVELLDIANTQNSKAFYIIFIVCVWTFETLMNKPYHFQTTKNSIEILDLWSQIARAHTDACKPICF